ncbi:MAG: HAD family hydrolase [bacterium]|nr:HAD family hydrolase [bacterium]
MERRFTHIFFDLHNTLVDGRAMHPCYSRVYGELMAERYGLTPDIWTQANRRIVADWDSYYADLDLGGEDGIAHMWEGLFRTTRAMFRIVGVPEPSREELTALAREVPGYATSRCDAFYPDAKNVIRCLADAGYVLGLVTHAIEVQARGTLQGGDMLAHFRGPIVSPDRTDRFNKDETFFALAARFASTDPSRCLVVDDSTYAIRGAKRAGMHTIHICRFGAPQHTPAHLLLKGTLKGLLPYLGI